MTTNSFAAKLSALSQDICPRDISFLEEACEQQVTVQKYDVFLQKGDSPRDACVLLDGIACRFQEPSVKFRQISAFLVPGDCCNLGTTAGPMDHSIGALSKCVVAVLSQDTVRGLFRSPAIARAIQRAAEIEEATSRAWLFNVGKRKANERSVHLLLELHKRLLLVGRAKPNAFELPLTQQEWGDALGLSLVHTNKSLQSLRKNREVEWRGGHVSLSDADALADVYKVDLSYLSSAKSAPDAT